MPLKTQTDHLHGEVSKPFTAVVGMGKTGQSCARYLKRKDIAFVMVDTRDTPPMLAEISDEFPMTPLFPGSLHEDILLEANEIIVSPGISIKESTFDRARAAGIPIVGDIEIFCREVTAPVIAITGSNGKSTVTSLLASILEADDQSVAVGANLGTPALDLLTEIDCSCYLLELSSFQLETVQSLNAQAAVVLNVSDDHMDRYGDLAEYAAAKSRIYRGDGLMLINLDDPWVRSMQSKDRLTKTYSIQPACRADYGISFEDGERWLVNGDQKILPRSELRLAGDHNVSNALAAIALADVRQVSRAALLSALRSFPGLPHRCQWVAEIKGVQWFNDSKGTNVGATIAAIEGLVEKGRIILIAGGDGKGADFSALADVAKNHLDAAILMGRDAPRIRQVLEGLIPLVDAFDMPAAVKAASRLARPGNIVLLSPACASQDMYEDYQARGQVFMDSVSRLVD